MLLKDASRDTAHAAVSREWVFIHEWFAGWRWERHQSGTLVSESLHSFETKDECVADANRNGRGTRKAAAHVTLRQRASNDEATELAA